MSVSGARGRSNKSSPHDLDFKMSVKLTGLPMDEFDRVWPKSVIPGARTWMVAHLSKGSYDRGEVTLKGGLKWDDIENMEIADAGGNAVASGGTVKYLDGMPPLTGGVGAKATFGSPIR